MFLFDGDDLHAEFAAWNSDFDFVANLFSHMALPMGLVVRIFITSPS